MGDVTLDDDDDEGAIRFELEWNDQNCIDTIYKKKVGILIDLWRKNRLGLIDSEMYKLHTYIYKTFWNLQT